VTTAASVILLLVVSLLADAAGGTAALRQLTLNVGACLGIGVLSAFLGEQLAQSGERLAVQRVRAADLAILKEYIIRSLSSGLLTVDRDGAVMTVNQAASEILSLDADAIIGQPVTAVLPALSPILAELGERQTLRRGEIRAARNGRELALGVSVTPLMDHRGEAIGRILNFQDLTELRRMEAQVKRAERLAVVGGVAAAVAHEIRNPLASISGSIELLRSAPQVGDENRQLMDIVVREVDRLNGLLGDLLDYARPREKVAMRIELGGVIDETVRVFAQDRTFAGVKVRPVLDPDATTRPVQADPAQLRQVVWNLLRNAAEAMPDGGEVRIELADAGGWAELRVIDEGVGIAPEDQEHLFEPFYTTKAGGSGLGLATVHRVVSEHGGTIGVTSSVGKGTTVTVRLPRPPA
jgi:two-component system sensor histidine kinase PilS (NtrC family)